MVKLIAFLKARPGMSRTNFIDHYENHHVPLIRGIAPQIQAYERNYVDLPPLRAAGGSGQLEYDVVTELSFATTEAYDAAMRALALQSDAIRADEAKFLDPQAMRLYRVSITTRVASA